MVRLSGRFWRAATAWCRAQSSSMIHTGSASNSLYIDLIACRVERMITGLGTVGGKGAVPGRPGSCLRGLVLSNKDVGAEASRSSLLILGFISLCMLRYIWLVSLVADMPRLIISMLGQGENLSMI